MDSDGQLIYICLSIIWKKMFPPAFKLKKNPLVIRLRKMSSRFPQTSPHKSDGSSLRRTKPEAATLEVRGAEKYVWAQDFEWWKRKPTGKEKEGKRGQGYIKLGKINKDSFSNVPIHVLRHEKIWKLIPYNVKNSRQLQI